MTIQEIIELLSKANELDSKTIDIISEKLNHSLTKVSRKTMKQFHIMWDGDKPWDEYIVAVCAEIKKCIEIELSDIGSLVREIEGLPPLTLNTEI